MPTPAPATVELLPEPEEKRIAATGAVASVQEAELSMPAEALAGLWRPTSLERLARGYWLYLTRASRGLIRVLYGESSRTVVLGPASLALLRFRAPEYETSAESAVVKWRIERGLLVAAQGRDSGWLRIEVRRQGATEPPDALEATARARLRILVEVQNFYPWLRGSGRFARFGAWLYSQTQVRIHRRITVGFLRSLASLELPPARDTASGAAGDRGEAR
jgi:hypothetical protein